MKPLLSPAHGTSLGTTAGITAVIVLVAATSVLAQCGGLSAAAAVFAACSITCLVLGAGGLYAGRNLVGSALDLAASDPAASAVAAARALVRFHAGMAGAFAGAGFAAAFRLALPHGGFGWLPPAAALVLAAVALARAAEWGAEARRRASGERPRGETGAARG